MSAISGGSFRDISVRFQNFLHLCQWFSNFNPKISAHLQKAGQHYGAAFSSSSHLINCCGEKQEHITSLGSLLNASNYSSCHMPVWKSKWEARWLTRQTFLLICIYSTHARCSSSPWWLPFSFHFWSAHNLLEDDRASHCLPSARFPGWIWSQITKLLACWSAEICLVHCGVKTNTLLSLYPGNLLVEMLFVVKIWCGAFKTMP